MCKVVNCFFLFWANKAPKSLHKLSLNHWSHMDFFPTFLGLENVTCVAVNAETESCQISLKKILQLYSEDERKVFELGTT